MTIVPKKVTSLGRLYGRFLVLGGLSGLLFSCKSHDQAEKPERTEPWRRDAKEGPGEQQLHKLEFRLAADQRLELTIPGRKAKPQGEFAGLSGTFEVAPNDLALTRGLLKIDLRHLRMADEIRPTASKSSKQATEDAEELEQLSRSGSWTVQALNWLQLGSGVKSPLPEATFRVDSLRELSHTRAAAGAVQKAVNLEGKSYQLRQVQATAVGELSVGGLSVQRTVPLKLTFYYLGAPDAKAVPHQIHVELRGGMSIPLAEYEIRPRDAQGHLITEQLELLGRYVGNTAFVRGTIQLQADETSIRP